MITEMDLIWTDEEMQEAKKEAYEQGLVHGYNKKLEHVQAGNEAIAFNRGYQQGREDCEIEHQAMCESCIHKIDKETLEGLLRDEREKVIEEIIKFRDMENLDEYEVGNLNELIRRLTATN